MKRIILVVLLATVGFVLAYTKPDAGQSSSGSAGGITQTVITYGTDSAGAGITTNTFTFVDGICTAF